MVMEASDLMGTPRRRMETEGTSREIKELQRRMYNK